MKKMTAWGLALLTAFFVFFGTGVETVSEAAGKSENTEKSEKTEISETADFPPLNEAGFLDEGEFVYYGEKEGLWRYASDSLWVEIHRVSQEKPARTWYEAEIRCAEGSETPHMIPNDPEKWLKSTTYPHKIARKNRTVIAISNDYAQLRYRQKARMGIIIRDGQIYSEKTRKKGANQFPTLDTLALLPDGDMQVYDSDEKTAQEYLEMGARDVLAFGPWLIRDGEPNPTAAGPNYTYTHMKSDVNPRTVIGMIEPYHYILMVVGIPQDNGKYLGANGEWLVNKLLELGCTEALNLDGGATSYMLFNGKTIIHGRKANRTLASMIAFGNLSD